MGKRVSSNKDLAVITGAGERTIQEAKVEDRWEDFRLDLIADTLKRREGGELAYFQRKRSTEELRLISDEKKRQRDEIPKLEAQAESILNAMKENPPGCKLYPGLVTALDRITKMLDERSGKATEEQEVADMQKALIKLAASSAKKPQRSSMGGENPSLTVDA
ncbi:hypothetical protein KAT92_05410, partial [Candidatus Babeliales bacterium]|nr:hypothetical protein [Candidatus Babeliales bacterium]